MKEDWRDETHALLDLLRHLSASDLSVLQAAVGVPGSQIATVKGSANDVFWSRLVDLGLARELTLDIELPPQLSHLRPKSFALTDEGGTAVRELLAGWQDAPPIVH